MEAQGVVNPTSEASLEPLHFLKSTDPPLWLAPSPSLSKATRIASHHLFSILKPFSHKSPFDHLLVDGFDAEQIWQQIDLQSQPLLARVRRDLKRFEKNPDEISNLKLGVEGKKNVTREIVEGVGKEIDDMEEGIEEFDEEEEEEEGEEAEEEDEDNFEGEEEDGDSEEGEKRQSNDEDERKGGGGGIEDGFLKIKELEEFLEEDEVREYGLQKNKNSKRVKRPRDSDDEETDDDEDREDDEDGEFDLDDEEVGDASKLEKARYEDFFSAKEKNQGRRKSKLIDELEDFDTDDEGDNGTLEELKSENLSTHQKQLMKLQSEIELMEKANLEPKTWTMQGEVTAAKRPKNSALEVDLDFEHNVRPAPVITEEVTATLEEMIQKRILEGRFDDVQKAPERPTKAPREIKELDENKSKKGLGEIYEQEYVEKTNLASAPSSLSDEMKKEASILFKKLCLKLDALSHFHFAPKPVIEDMSIQANVPALAMEEIAPVAVSDAAMLAPEEVFAGKGDIKESAELTQTERKRRRANKKRRYKAMVTKRDAKKARNAAVSKPTEG